MQCSHEEIRLLLLPTQERTRARLIFVFESRQNSCVADAGDNPEKRARYGLLSNTPEVFLIQKETNVVLVVEKYKSSGICYSSRENFLVGKKELL